MKDFLGPSVKDPIFDENIGKRFTIWVVTIGIAALILELIWWISNPGSSLILGALIIAVCFAIFGLSFLVMFRRSVEEQHRKLEETKKLIEAAFADLVVNKSRTDRYFDFLAHDMANFLAPMMSYSVMISSHPTAPAEIKRYSKKIVDQTDKAANFITNMRRLLEAEGYSVTTAPAYDISSKLKTLEERVRKENAKKRISFKVNIPENQQVSVAGGEFVDDILFNILQNSAKHTKADEARINVTISPLMDEAGKAFWQIAIEDEGPGIPDSKKAIIANPFETTQKFSKGAVTTLTFMSAIARHFGGRIWIEDRVPGAQTKGTRVVVVLPSIKATRD